MAQEEVIKLILDEAIYIHKSVGPGMLKMCTRTASFIVYEKEDCL